ncbi:transcriptional regulator [Mycobacterium sp. CVI_P3]|uniref:Transcriptional regulator n=1 Tax=Mycobacterium pinniadriaticum TaxID=2994102 RepID=A0ABT3SNP0_9MYCO|nr:transcriptional regulator [Mycobacterium pinniadriaticum]MCX2934704.1 transcriptional regulator [Mycobacterium pinniadriaticum]MCX2941144.1 transcriptional regulator [Mycobacterium pinniadriaticum]
MSAADAEHALVEALEAVGLTASLTGSAGDAADIEVRTPDGRTLFIEAKYRTLASADVLPRQLGQYAHQLARTQTGAGKHVVGVFVADRITEDARAMLESAGWGWLDLRGRLHLAAPGIYVHADIAPVNKDGTAPDDPFAGRAGLEAAVELLLNPGQSVGVRSLAHRIGRAPSTVSEVLARLRRANLIDTEHIPMIPDLFWGLTSAWRPASVDVASLPSPADRAVRDALRINDDINAGTGWALTDTTAAAYYRAPVGLRADHPPDFYVPDMRTLRRAAQVLGAATDPGTRAATLKAAPVVATCAARVRIGESEESWPMARPLFVALDLAKDPSRGHEILAQWTPPEPWARVW